jgi:FkbM family methyltransferase
MKIHGVPATRFFVSRVLWAARCSAFLTFKTPAGHQLRFYPSSVSAMLWCDPHFFANDEKILAQYLRPGDTFVDVGANIGALSLTASGIVGEAGRIFSVEAHPQTVDYLRGNIKLNNAGNVTVIHAAAGDHEGVVNFSSDRSDDQNRVTETGISVPLRTLDSLLPDTPVRLLKIDVEGFELFALRGAERILQRTDMVYFESWESHFSKYGYSTPDVLEFLTMHGFEVNRPADYKSAKCENLLAVRLAT